MTKIHKTKLALLGATAFFAATSAHAQVADSWSIVGDVNVSALNSGAVANDPVTGGTVAGIEGAEITAGYKNSISGATVGGSASSSFSSVNNSGVGGDAVVEFGGAITVVAGSSGEVLNNTDVITGATVGGGNANSISLAAVGSSASVSGSTTLTDVAGAAVPDGETFSYTSGQLIVSSGAADGSVDAADATVGGNSGAVTLALATSLTAPTIAGGNGNSISVAGLGSSASASFSAAVDGDGSVLDSFDLTLADGALISSANSATGTIAVGLGAGATTPAIAGGNANAISSAALGSSASFSLSSGTSTGGVVTAFNAAVGELVVDSSNLGGVTLGGGQDGADQATYDDASIAGAGNNNSISAAALGSSGSVSYANTVFDTGGGAAAGDVTFDAITVNSTNSGEIINNVNLTTGGNIDGGAKNSISIAGLGASASQSISITDNSGAGVTGVATAIGSDITLAAVNSGAVSVLGGGLQAAVIADGFSNSVSAAAVGASASQSVSRTVLLTQ